MRHSKRANSQGCGDAHNRGALMGDGTADMMSLMTILNRRGVRTVPGGTPLSKIDGCEYVFPVLT